MTAVVAMHKVTLFVLRTLVVMVSYLVAPEQYVENTLYI